MKTLAAAMQLVALALTLTAIVALIAGASAVGVTLAWVALGLYAFSSTLLFGMAFGGRTNS